MDLLTVCNSRSDLTPRWITKRKTAPQRDEGITFEVLGSCDRNERRQINKWSPRNKTQHLVSTGLAKLWYELCDDNQRALNETGSSENVDERRKYCRHCCNYAFSNALLDLRCSGNIECCDFD